MKLKSSNKNWLSPVLDGSLLVLGLMRFTPAYQHDGAFSEGRHVIGMTRQIVPIGLGLNSSLRFSLQTTPLL